MPRTCFPTFVPQFLCHSEFRAGLVAADQNVIYPILGYLLPKLEEFKKRAYLSTYLMKIDVPDDILQDEEVVKGHTRVRHLSFIYLTRLLIDSCVSTWS